MAKRIWEYKDKEKARQRAKKEGLQVLWRGENGKWRASKDMANVPYLGPKPFALDWENV